MDKVSLDEMLDRLNLISATPSESKFDDIPVSVCLLKGYKSKFDRLQSHTKKRFVRGLREMMQATIDKALAQLEALEESRSA
jgi:hypothetical protein